MSKVAGIHQGKQPVRRHYLAEWLAERQMSAPDLLDALNDPERAADLPMIDKSQVYRWLKGQMPQAAMQQRIADALSLDDAADLLRDPVDDWVVKFFEGRSREDREKAMQLLELAFPKRDGTNG